MAQSPPGRVAKRIGAALMILAAVLGVVSIIGIVAGAGSSLRQTLSGPVYTAPAGVNLELKARKYVVMEETGSRSGGSGFSITHNGPLTLGPDDVRVTGPGGATVQTDYPNGTQTVSRGNVIFTGAASFDVADAGEYQVAIAGSAGTRFVIAEDLGSSFESVAGWAVLGFGAGALLVLGVILMLVGAARQRAQTPGLPILVGGTDNPQHGGQQYGGQQHGGQQQGNQPYSGQQPYQYGGAHSADQYGGAGQYGGQQQTLPPAGWYADPQVPGQSRYWDGNRWV